ncbi:MAG: trigger factor [Patescibacteria group bacterium]
MTHTAASLPKSRLKIDVRLTPEEFAPHLTRAAVLMSEENPIDGFRPGKAPYDAVRRVAGEASLERRGAEIAIGKTYQDVIKALTLEGKITEDCPAVGSPEIAVTEAGGQKGLAYTIVLSLTPSVALPDDYRIRVGRVRSEKKDADISDEEMAKALDEIRESRAALITVDRPAETGDAVEIDFVARQAGVKIEQGESRHHPFILGRGRFIPGFEEELIGMAAGAQKDFTIVVPPDWRDTALRGKALDFHVVMQLVQERLIPEATDEFARSLGDFASMEDLTARIKDGIRRGKERDKELRLRNRILEEMRRSSVLGEMPEVLIVEECRALLSEYRSALESSGMAWTEYLLHVGKTEEKLLKENADKAADRAASALVLRAIARREGITPDDRDVDARVDAFLQTASSDEKRRLDREALRAHFRGALRNEKVFEFLEEQTKVHEEV